MIGRLSRLAAALTRDKADTLLLLGAAVLVLAPHAAHLPAWISALCAAMLLWRGLVTFRGKRMPPNAVLVPLALAAMVGVFQNFHTLLGRDAGVAMLVLLVTFKMLEMRARRDLFVVLYLFFFLVLTNFFYSQAIATGLLMAATIIVLLTAQMTFQYTGAVPPLKRRLWTGARIFLYAVPVALLFFYGFPRIEGPLWGMPGDAGSGRSGLSNSMSPGKLSNLALSDDPAFRVQFFDAPPAQPALYWRAIVLGNFDGRSWTQTEAHGGAFNVQLRGKPVRYQVTQEPGSSRWIYALELPGEVPAIERNPTAITPELEMTAAYALDQRVRYTVASYPDYSIDAGRRLDDSARWLRLPVGFNPRSIAAGEALRALAPAQRVQQVLERFNKDGYVYTLEPPLLGTDSVDEFLFVTRSGFCEHFAGAFVVLMRAAGVPARVVTGYQGGEINPVDQFMTVRQSDAHAWAEVWLAPRGWVRVDPTAAVAPERVRHNLARALPRKPPFGMEALAPLIRFGGDANSWLARLRFQWSALNNGWNQWVLNYTPQRRDGFLDGLGEAFLHWRSAAALLGVALLAALLQRLRLRRQLDPVHALYCALCAKLAQRGLPRAADEGPSAYARRVAASALPADGKAAIARFLQLYSAHQYGRAAPDPALPATLKRLLNEFR